jgi:hypothetical protein
MKIPGVVPDAMDLGEGNGLLIRGAQAEGNWYFGWDANADGIWNGSTMDDYSIFSTGTQFHGQTISGVTLKAPVLGVEPPTAGANPGTNISDGLTDNPTYDGLLAIWDAHNGSTTASNEGLPAQWMRDQFWSRSEDAVSGGSHYFVLNPLNGTAYSIDTSVGSLAASLYQVI